MKRFAYVFLSLGFFLATLCPVFVFAFKKYHGLEDYEIYEEVVTEEFQGCYIKVSLRSFQQTYPSDSLCGALLCTEQGCGLKISEGAKQTVFLEQDELRDGVEALYSEATPSVTSDDTAAIDEGAEEAEVSIYEYPLWQWLSIFSFAIAFSLLGITISVVLRKGVGIGGDLTTDLAGFTVVYFMAIGSGLVMVSLFAGGFLQGSMFPNFSGDIANFGFNSWSALSFRGDDWFKLAIWCYVAGFYERFIPDVLDKVMQRADEEAQSGAEKPEEPEKPA